MDLSKELYPHMEEACKDTEFAASHAGKIEELTDDEMEKVSGGWTNFFPCDRKFSRLWCELTFCPHRKRHEDIPDEKHYTEYCDLNYWEMVVERGDGSGY